MIEFYLDIDGVILDFESSFVDFVRDYYIPDLPADYILQSWEMGEEFKSLDIEEVWGKFVNSDHFSCMPLIAEKESFNNLSSAFPLYLVTNIPNAQFKGRVANLNLHGLEYSGLHLAGHFNFGDESYPTKSQKIKELRKPESKIIFLDDHPKNCLDVKSNFPDSQVYLMDRPHNKEVRDQSWTRVMNWLEFYHLMKQRIFN
ncbi:MAG: hypothetical protein MJE63_19340 [Proteobacteria bacterium]|nr:hypothetical protein [Pseudomonadota bacterium]